MKKIPCLVCESMTESDNDKVIAKVCDSCLKKVGLDALLKTLDFRQLQRILKRKLTLTKDGELI